MVFLSLLAPLATLLRSDMMACLFAGFRVEGAKLGEGAVEKQI